MDGIMPDGDGTAAATAYQLDTAAADLVCMEEMHAWKYATEEMDCMLDVWGLPISEYNSVLMPDTGLCDYFGTQ